MVFHSFRRLLSAALVFAATGSVLLSQTDFDVGIARHKGNKIVLLGEWKPGDVTKWAQSLDSDELYGYGLALLDKAKLSEVRTNYSPEAAARDMKSFDPWFRQKYGVSASARWAALDTSNKFLVSGQQMPSPKELDQLLERKGIKTLSKQLRDFLKENPGHIDATSDLLKEVRRRALRVMPKDANKDLDDETDLRTWAVMAAETDKAFGTPWLGLNIEFFWADQDQPERFSKQMKAVFRKHIPKVESALRLQPTDSGLWNIWTWMARGLGDYKWSTFINSIETFEIRIGGQFWLCPSAEACVWLVRDASAKKDWATVAKLAKIARRYAFTVKGDPGQVEWTPGGRTMAFNIPMAVMASNFDHPLKSAFLPHLEALVRLGDIEGANAVYDEMLRWSLPSESPEREGYNPIDKKLEFARAAAEMAKAAGMADLAKLWEKGESVNKTPYNNGIEGMTYFYAFTQMNSDFHKNLDAVLRKLTPPTGTNRDAIGWRDHPTLGWKIADGDRWGLIGEDGLLLAQGKEVPDVETLQSLWGRTKKANPEETLRKYAAEYPGVAMDYSSYAIRQVLMAFRNRSRSSQNAPAQPSTIEDEQYLGDATKLLKGVVSDNSSILANLPPSFRESSMTIALASSWIATMDDPPIKALSGPFLAAIEPLLEKKPSSDTLWGQWFFWRALEGRERPLELLIAKLRYSPLSANDMGLPPFALDMYWDDCKRNGNWAKVVELLEGPWERELARAIEIKDGLVDENQLRNDPRYRQSGSTGDRIGLPLIEAYLNNGKPNEANSVFNAWLDTGQTFRDISAIASLARTKGQEKLAQEWEAIVKK
ncbi:MAG: hypothetical protein LBC63_09210 [Holophagales bacterium]|jgi:hypothetical protein|nr:hypothetical protein [Holophagales bacterium]